MDGVVGWRHQNCHESDGALCWSQDALSRASAQEKARARGQLALGLGSAPGVGLEGLGRDPAGRGQEEGKDTVGTFCLLPWILPPNHCSFLHLPNIFSEMENNLNV